MKNISLVSVIYLFLGINAVKTFDTFTSDGFMFLTKILYIVMIAGSVILLLNDIIRRDENRYKLVRTIVIFSTLIIIIGVATGVRLETRKITVPENTLNDSAYMTETASNILISGKNPYAEHFEGTPFGQTWLPIYIKYGQAENTIEHYVYLPFFLLANTFFQIITSSFGGWSDPRLILILSFFGSLALFYLIPQKQDYKLIALLIAGLSPHFLRYFLEGQNDIFFFFLIFLSLFLLQKNRIFWSTIVFGLACASKQPAWLMLPFYAFYFFYQSPENIKLKEKIWFAAKKFWPALAIFLLFILPFFIWSPKNFLADTIFYSTGGSSDNMPISGANLGGLLTTLNVISDTHGYLFFWVLLFIIGLPFLWWLLKWQKNNNHPGQLMISYTAFSLIFFLFFRFFNEAYFGFLTLSALAAWVFFQRENEMRQGKIAAEIKV